MQIRPDLINCRCVAVDSLPAVERKWLSLVAVITGIFMLLIDITIVNVALPDIGSDLDASFSSLEWVVNAYTLTLASSLLVSGSLADLIGRKKVFAGGLVIFTLASLACALAERRSGPLDDNLTVPVVGAAIAWLALPFSSKAM